MRVRAAICVSRLTGKALGLKRVRDGLVLIS
jgi:hypothetical protein